MDMATAPSQTHPSSNNSNNNRHNNNNNNNNNSANNEGNNDHLHALDVSEIRSLIAEYLTKQDLGVCILVCKKWSLDFIPLYWRTIFVQPHKVTRYPDSVLRQHGQHLRILHAGRIEETSVFNQASVDQLQSLEISTCGSKEREDGGRGCLQEIVYRNWRGLMSLNWRCFGRDTTMERSFRLWPAMFQGLQALVELELSNWSLSRVDFLRMLIACPMLRKLTFQAVEDIQETTGGRQGRRSSLQHLGEPVGAVTTATTTLQNASQGNNNMANTPRKSPPQEDERLLELQHTTLASLTFIGELIPSFLQHVPNITRLEIINIMQGDFKDMDEQVMTKPCCTEVTHLTLMTECSAPLRYLSTVMVMSTLVSFEGIVPFQVLDDFLELILRSHSQTIEVLLLRERNPLQQQQSGFQFNVWRFFESCPRLFKLEIPYSLRNCVGLAVVNTNGSPPRLTHPYHDYPNYNNVSNGNHIPLEVPPFSEATLELRLYEPTREWVCKDLRRLQLRIEDMDQTRSMQQIPFDLCVDRLLPPEQKRDNSRRTRSALERMILERLSGLEKLEALNIGGGWYTLTARKS
ncbi:hypothetical protein BGZ47_009866 [Haplosporangium gracile]|nr:hypothetical protein BGZ47_009866 [Haplosporangium gracile]